MALLVLDFNPDSVLPRPGLLSVTWFQEFLVRLLLKASRNC